MGGKGSSRSTSPGGRRLSLRQQAARFPRGEGVVAALLALDEAEEHLRQRLAAAKEKYVREALAKKAGAK